MEKTKRQFSISRNIWVFASDPIDILMGDMGITKQALLNTMEETGFASKEEFESVKARWLGVEEDVGAKKVKIKITVQVEEV